MKIRAYLIVFSLLVTGCILITNQTSEVVTPEIPTTQPTTETLPNPASAYCEQQGYTLEIHTTASGSQSGICIFPNGSECDEWAYFRGECLPANQGSSMPNPASVFCEEQGFKLEIRTANDGSQTGVCIFPDGSECDEWAFFRGECTPPRSSEVDSYGWKIYTNDALGYTFHYPADALVITNDEPLKSLYISGSGMEGEAWSIAHPGDRDEFRPPVNVDLMKWLTDHYLVGEVRLPDEQIAGTTAVHFRHERSPQSPADDKYFMAKNGQLYLLTIGHSNEIEDWELNNRFLQSIQFQEPTSIASVSTPIPTAFPVDPTAYADWMTYTHPIYNFSIRLPVDWSVEEVTTGDPLLIGHALNLHSLLNPQAANIRITFRQVGEEVPLWPTGIGQGEFLPQGALDIAGLPAQRILMVCPTGEITSTWYQNEAGQPAIRRGNLEFGVIFSTYGHCEPGYSLDGATQLTGETIISSLQVP
jgi:putative hemolysin